MADEITSIIIDVLQSFYREFFPSLLLATLFMYVYLYAVHSESGGKGWKRAVLDFFVNFKESQKFRKVFYLSLYTGMILSHTLLNREIWNNPLTNVVGNWGLYVLDSKTGEMILTTECIENIILFLPFGILCMLFREQGKKEKCFLRSIILSFLLSVSIELLQLLLHFGTFQLSDLFFNTLGGTIGGSIYCVIVFVIEFIHKKIK